MNVGEVRDDRKATIVLALAGDFCFYSYSGNHLATTGQVQHADDIIITQVRSKFKVVLFYIQF
jgi:hypothetical protein